MQLHLKLAELIEVVVGAVGNMFDRRNGVIKIDHIKAHICISLQPPLQKLIFGVIALMKIYEVASPLAC